MKFAKLKGFFNNNKRYIVFISVVWALFMVLIYLAPYTGDDWPWGSEIGVFRLDSWFADYNGRYAGNLLVLILTRSEFLQIIVISLSMVAVCVLPLFITKKKSLSMLSVSVMLLMIMPHPIFIQGIMWTSGFTNYMPPVIITLAYMVIIKNIFDDTAPKYTRSQHIYLSLIAGLLGFVSAFFMENVSIYNIIVGATVLIFALVKFKRAYPVHISYLIATVAGFALMLTNGAYKNAVNGTDFYRSFASFENLDLVFRHLDFICVKFFSENILSIGFISLLCIALLIKSITASASRKRRYALTITLCVNLITLVLIFARYVFSSWQIVYGAKNLSIVLFAGIVILYSLSVLLTVILTVKETSLKLKLTALLLSMPVLLVPFLVISPLNTRCLIPAYMILIVFGTILFNYTRTAIDLKSSYVKLVTVCASAVALGMLTFFISVYSVIHKYEHLRVEYIEKQIDCGITEDVVFTHIPYASYAWMEAPGNEEWANHFKSFYGFSKEIKFKYVSVEEFDLWREEFDKTHSN